MRVTPEQGGRLMTRTSSEVPAFQNYTWKHDMRRDLSDEMRREGDDYWMGQIMQAFPQNSNVDVTWPINLVHYVRRPNGKAAVVVGTRTTLFRYQAGDDGAYFLADVDPQYFSGDYYTDDGSDAPPGPYFTESEIPEGYFDSDYFVSGTGGWQVIGRGFSLDGHRWEALNINGYAVFNNGVDLLQTYRVEDEQVYPMYELREVGVGLVGTIWENNGALMAGDIGQMRAETFAENFAHVSSGFTTAKQYGSMSGGAVTGTSQVGTVLRSADPGSYVEASGVPAYNDWSGGFTVEAMIRVADPSDAMTIIEARETPGTLNPFTFAISDHLLTISVDGGSETLSAPFYQTGWTHVAATIDAAAQIARLYVDGTLVATGEMVTPPTIAASDPWLFFCRGGTLGTTLDMSFLRLWTVPRTNEELVAYVADNTAEGLLSPDLVAWFKMDEGTGTLVNNTQFGNSEGELQGAPLPTWIAAITPSDSYVVVSAPFFTASSLDKYLTFTNGLTVQIVTVLSTTLAKVSGSVTSLDGLQLAFRVFSTDARPQPITGAITTMVRTAGLVALAGPIGSAFTELSVGQLIRVPAASGGEEVRAVASIIDSRNLTVDLPWLESGSTGLWRVSDYTVLANAEIFAATDVGRELYWPDGTVRVITAYRTARRVDVNSHMPIPEGVFSFENQTAYGPIAASLLDRIQYRTIWGALDEPRVWNATVPVSIIAGARLVSLAYPARSLLAGEQVTILGAGTLGASFTSTILLVAADGMSLILDAAATTTVEDALLHRTASIGSIAGFEDLQDVDASAIIKGLDLRGRTLIYKDASIFLCDFTANPAQPFNFTRIYQGADVPYYRHTLSNPQGTYHLYAARTGFFFFDLTSQVPQRAELFDFVENLFYEVATLEKTDEIFAGICGPTKEVFFMFPDGLDGVKGIAFDFKYRTLSTLGIAYTAVNTVKKPIAGIPTGVQEDWCVCGDEYGTVILYGRANSPQAQWNGQQAVFSRRGSSYISKLRGGLFSGGWGEMDVTGYLPEVSSHGVGGPTPIQVKLHSYRNPAEAGRLLFNRLVPRPHQNNLIPTFFRANYFQDEIVIDGVNNPFRLAARSVEAGPVRSDGIPRRP